jgi:hypothetical protein
VFDRITGNPLNEGTEEYFYKDVVSVTTKTESQTVNIVAKGLFIKQLLGIAQLNSAEKFILTTSGGTSISVVLKDPSLIERMGGGVIPTDRTEKAIAAVRKMLREKKGS